jgi:hypothetical protein
MRNRKYNVRVPVTVNFDSDTLEAFKEICHKQRLSMSERLNAFMAEEVKKEVSPLQRTPINIIFSNDINQQGKKLCSISLCYDKFLGVDEIKPILEDIPSESLSKAYSNSRRLYQQLQFKTEGKITVQ